MIVNIDRCSSYVVLLNAKRFVENLKVISGNEEKVFSGEYRQMKQLIVQIYVLNINNQFPKRTFEK